MAIEQSIGLARLMPDEVVYVVGTKRQHMGGGVYREPGELIPEARDWRWQVRESYLRQGLIVALRPEEAAHLTGEAAITEDDDPEPPATHPAPLTGREPVGGDTGDETDADPHDAHEGLTDEASGQPHPPSARARRGAGGKFTKRQAVGVQS